MANEIYHRSNWGNAVNDNAWGDVYEKFDATNEMFVRSDNYENSNETDKLMAAINPKPSILLTPTAYDNGSLHSVKPSNVSSTLVNSDVVASTNNPTLTNVTNSSFTISSSVSNSRAYINVANTFQGARIRVSFNYTSANSSYYLRNGVNGYGTILGSGYLTTSGLVSKDVQLPSNSSEINLLFVGGGGVSNMIVSDIKFELLTDADFDFTRGSSATRVNSQGLIEDVQILSGELVQNGDYSQIGSELITNGDFSQIGQDWTFSDGATVTNNGARIVSDGAYQYIVQNNVLTVGKQYKIQYEIVENNSGGNLKLQTSTGINPIPSTVGIHTIYGKALQTFLTIERSGACDITITNISVKEVGQNWSSYDGNVIFKQGSVQIDTNGAAYTEFRAGNDFNSPDAILTIGNKYRLTYTISESNSGGIKTNSLIANDTILTSTVGTHTIEGLATLTSLGILRNGDTDITITNISVIEITDDTNLPRIDYTSGTGSLLLEPQSTNLVTYSEDFNLTGTPSSGTGSQNNATTTPSSLPSPDGGTSAFTFIYDGTFNASIKKSPTVAADQAVTMSIFIKKTADTPTFSADDKIQIGIFNNVVSPVNLNLGNALNAAPLGEWKRYSVSATGGSSGGVTIPNVRCDVAASIDVFGWQLETNSFATSYIPTSGSTVTRLADVCNNAGSSDLINSTEGVLYAEISALANDGTFRVLGLDDNTSTLNNVSIYYRSNANTITFRLVSNGTQVVFDYLDVGNALDFHKVAFKYKSGDSKVYIDGVLKNTYPTTSMPLNLKHLSFEQDGGGLNFYGKVKSVAVFKEALSNDQLEGLTGEGYETFNLLAQANNYTII